MKKNIPNKNSKNYNGDNFIDLISEQNSTKIIDLVFSNNDDIENSYSRHFLDKNDLSRQILKVEKKLKENESQYTRNSNKKENLAYISDIYNSSMNMNKSLKSDCYSQSRKKSNSNSVNKNYKDQYSKITENNKIQNFKEIYSCNLFFYWKIFNFIFLKNLFILFILIY